MYFIDIKFNGGPWDGVKATLCDLPDPCLYTPTRPNAGGFYNRYNSKRGNQCVYMHMGQGRYLFGGYIKPKVKVNP